MRVSGILSVVVFCGDYPSLVLPLIWINRKGSRLSVMPRKRVAGEMGWEVITAAAVVVLVLYVLLGPHN